MSTEETGFATDPSAEPPGPVSTDGVPDARDAQLAVARAALRRLSLIDEMAGMGQRDGDPELTARCRHAAGALATMDRLAAPKLDTAAAARREPDLDLFPQLPPAERQRDTTRILLTTITALSRSLKAAFIELEQGRPEAAREWIANAVPGETWEGDEWDGTETAQQWADRTDPEVRRG